MFVQLYLRCKVNNIAFFLSLVANWVPYFCSEFGITVVCSDKVACIVWQTKMCSYIAPSYLFASS